MKIRALIAVFLMGITIILGGGFWAVSAQDETTPTPVPTLDLGANIYAPTSTPLPPTVTQLIRVMEEIGLRQEELPGDNIFIVPNPDNGTFTVQELAELWSERYPDNPLVDSLEATHISSGVLALSLSEFVAEDCTGLNVYGLGSRILLMTGENSARSFIKERSLWELRQGLFNWEATDYAKNGGLIHTAPDDSDICERRGTFYLLEYPHERYVIGVTVYVPEGTDLELVADILEQIAAVIADRIDNLEVLSTATPTMTPEPTLTVTITPSESTPIDEQGE